MRITELLLLSDMYCKELTFSFVIVFTQYWLLVSLQNFANYILGDHTIADCFEIQAWRAMAHSPEMKAAFHK